MPHIDTGCDSPGIVGLLRFRPETGRPLSELAEVLLRRSNSLSRGERELIAAHVSALNECQFCTSSHAALAAAQLPEGMPLVQQVNTDLEQSPLSGKMKQLLKIAAKVQRGGREVAPA